MPRANLKAMQLAQGKFNKIIFRQAHPVAVPVVGKAGLHLLLWGLSRRVSCR